eukprot:scaffold5633_cov89-Isochrysis_galbana.AAC.2
MVGGAGASGQGGFSGLLRAVRGGCGPRPGSKHAKKRRGQIAWPEIVPSRLYSGRYPGSISRFHLRRDERERLVLDLQPTLGTISALFWALSRLYFGHYPGSILGTIPALFWALSRLYFGHYPGSISGFHLRRDERERLVVDLQLGVERDGLWDEGRVEGEEAVVEERGEVARHLTSEIGLGGGSCVTGAPPHSLCAAGVNGHSCEWDGVNGRSCKSAQLCMKRCEWAPL